MHKEMKRYYMQLDCFIDARYTGIMYYPSSV